jgi:DNA polymerase-4
MDNEISVERSTEIAQSMKSGIAKNIGPYMRCSIGIAPNRYLAKVGTELQKPDGLVVLRAEDLPQKLFRLKLRDLPGSAPISNTESRRPALRTCRACSRSILMRCAQSGAASGAKRCGICCAAWNCQTR